MEGDVVLAQEVVAPALRVFPELSPGLRVAALLGPLLGRRQVADDRLEPDVDALVLVALERNGYAPLDVAGDRSILKAFVEQAERPVEHGLAPMGLVVQPLFKALVEGAQAEEEVLRLADLRRGSAEAAAHPQKLGSVERLAALLALVAASAVVAAVRTGSFHVAIGQETAIVGAVGQGHTLLIDMALVQEGQEDILSDAGVVLGAGGRVQVEGYAQALPAVEELLVKLGGHFLGRSPLLFGADGDRGAVLVAAGDHENTVALDAVVSGEDVGWKLGADDLSQMQRAVGIRPSYTDEDLLSQASSFRLSADNRDCAAILA